LIEEWRNFCAQLFERHQLFHSFWLNFQPNKTNTIFGEKWLHINGPEILWQYIYGVDIAFGPSHFAQANLAMMEKLLGDLVGYIPPHIKVVELYGGVGVIGLSLREKVDSCIIVEREESAAFYFHKSQERLSEEAQKKFSFHTCDAREALAYISHHDTVIVDPPRKGLSRPVIDLISPFDRLFYVSCNFETLARDAEQLQARGFMIKQAKSYYFFPGTNHIELLVHFEKKSG
jgi:tRNA/tmRNA/rRNA uracil-C5-methylase (TrmA/RlmC/RlmD family)